MPPFVWLVIAAVLKHRNSGPSAEPTLVGREAQVIERIDGTEITGRVQTDDHISWMARSSDGQPIDVGETVAVVGQESIKLIVERKNA